MKIIQRFFFILILLGLAGVVAINLLTYLYQNFPTVKNLLQVAAIEPFIKEVIQISHTLPVEIKLRTFLLVAIVFVPGILKEAWLRWRDRKKFRQLSESERFSKAARYHVESVTYSLIYLLFYTGLGFFTLITVFLVILYALPWEQLQAGGFLYSRGPRQEFLHQKIFPFVIPSLSALTLFYLILKIHSSCHFLLRKEEEKPKEQPVQPLMY